MSTQSADRNGDFTFREEKDVDEPPVREKLKKTSIAVQSLDPANNGFTEMINKSSISKSITTESEPSSGRSTNESGEFKERICEKRNSDNASIKSQEPKCSKESKKAEKSESHIRTRSKSLIDKWSDKDSVCTKNKISSPCSEETAAKLGVEGRDRNIMSTDDEPSRGNNEHQVLKYKEIATATSPKHENLPEATELGQRRQKTPPQNKKAQQEDSLVEAIGSPRNKRTRDDFKRDYGKAYASDESSASRESPGHKSEINNDEGPNSKRQRDSNSPQPAADVKKEPVATSAIASLHGGFSNTSTVSPFGTVTVQDINPSKRHPGSQIIATSGRSSLSGSAISSFTKYGHSTSSTKTLGYGIDSRSYNQTSEHSSFPARESVNLEQAKVTQPSGKFGFASSTSPTSGFGVLGNNPKSGFGALGGANLTTFASGGTPGDLINNQKANIPFGAAPDTESVEQTELEDDEGGIRSPQSKGNQIKRQFFVQNVETGEEDEDVVFSCRAKLYNYVKAKDDKKEWKERGLGTLKLNIKKSNEGEEKGSSTKARLILRADGSHRVVLNSPVKKELKFGDPSGHSPSNGYLYFWGSIEGKPSLELLQLKMKQESASQLYEHFVGLQKLL